MNINEIVSTVEELVVKVNILEIKLARLTEAAKAENE